MKVFGINNSGQKTYIPQNFGHNTVSLRLKSDKFEKAATNPSLDLAQSAFKKIEANIVGPLNRFLDKTAADKKVEKVDNAYLSKIFRIPNNKDYLTSIFAAHIVRIVFDAEEKTGENIDREFVFTHMKSTAQEKAETCKEAENMQVQALVYEKIAEACGALAKEIYSENPAQN